MPDPQPFRSDNPIVQRLLAGSAPERIRLLAARGALPFTQEELLHVLFSLRDDPNPEVQQSTSATIAGMPDESLAGLLRGPMPAPLLHFYAQHLPGKPAALAAVVGNRSVADATLEAAASTAGTEVLELLVTNQVVLIRSPRIIDTLLANPALSLDQRRRLLEVREEFFVKKELEEKRRRDEEERLARLRAKKEWSLHELEQLQEDLAREAHADREAGVLPPDADEHPAAETEELHLSASQRILQASVPEKVLLAIRGSRTERNILIKDANRLVASSVIKSPKLTDAEIESYAGMRNINDEILRFIGSRREWLRSYSVVLTLVKNPRTPLAVSINLLARLQAADVRKLLTDRNVSETLRRQAKSMIDRAQRGGAH